MTGKLASLNRSWQSNKGTFSALGLAGIEPMPSESEWLDTVFALDLDYEKSDTARLALLRATNWNIYRYLLHKL